MANSPSTDRAPRPPSPPRCRRHRRIGRKTVWGGVRIRVRIGPAPAHPRNSRERGAREGDLKPVLEQLVVKNLLEQYRHDPPGNPAGPGHSRQTGSLAGALAIAFPRWRVPRRMAGLPPGESQAPVRLSPRPAALLLRGGTARNRRSLRALPSHPRSYSAGDGSAVTALNVA
jgi:hypothetical protein